MVWSQKFPKFRLTPGFTIFPQLFHFAGDEIYGERGLVFMEARLRSSRLVPLVYVGVVVVVTVFLFEF